MKKILIFALVMFTFCFIFSIQAVAVTEIENNDDWKIATKIEYNSGVYGNISNNDDVDMYKFVTLKDGYVSIEFKHEVIDNTSNLWQITLYDGDYNWLCETYSTGKTATVNMSEQGITAGTYYVKVRAAWTSQYSKYSNSTQYNFTVKYTESDYWEKETNETWMSSTAIKCNTSYNGSIRYNDDMDIYKFVTLKDGYVSIEFKHEVIDNTSNLWQITLYDGDYNWLCETYSTGKTATVNMSEQGITAGTYYVKVRAAWTSQYSKYSNSTQYNFTVKYTESDYWEKETNETWVSSTAIKCNTSYNGSIRYNDDMDIYKFVTLKDGYVSIEFKHEVIDNTSNLWQITLYDGDYNWLCETYSTGKTAMVNMSEQGITAGTYYVKVRAAWTSQYSKYSNSAQYNFTVKYTESDYWEKEINDDWKHSNCTKIGDKIFGTIRSNDDYDYYCFEMIHSGDVSLLFEHEYINSNSNYWLISLYDSEYNMLSSYYSAGDQKSTVNKVLGLTPGKYYAVIRAGWTSQYSKFSSNVKYSLIITTENTVHKNSDWCIVSNPTCIDKGLEQIVCTVCGEIVEEKTIDPLGHSINNWTVDIASTCSSEGKRHCICGVCGETVSENIPMIAHTFGAWNVTKAPTCHSNGTQTRSCSKCDHTETETLSALTHEFGEWKVAQEASCYHSGTEERECSLCGDKENKTIEQLIHEYGEWEVVSGSKLIPPIVKEKTCVHCADVQSTEDWSYVWVTIVAGVVLLGVLIGVINYIRAFKRR